MTRIPFFLTIRKSHVSSNWNTDPTTFLLLWYHILRLEESFVLHCCWNIEILTLPRFLCYDITFSAFGRKFHDVLLWTIYYPTAFLLPCWRHRISNSYTNSDTIDNRGYYLLTYCFDVTGTEALWSNITYEVYKRTSWSNRSVACGVCQARGGHLPRRPELFDWEIRFSNLRYPFHFIPSIIIVIKFYASSFSRHS